MGRRGPVPAADNVRQLRGMKPLRTPNGEKAKRLALPPKAPAPPSNLSRAAGAEWRRVTKELARAGVLADVDRGILTTYCTAWAHMMEAEAIMKSEGIVSIGPNKNLVRHPAWIIYREASRIVVTTGSQLYLSPVARLRIPLSPGSAAIGEAYVGSSDFD